MKNCLKVNNGVASTVMPGQSLVWATIWLKRTLIDADDFMRDQKLQRAQ
jgi:hypothetical protein